MTNKANIKRYGKRDLWRLQFQMLKQHMLTQAFPNGADYVGSVWAEWGRRIREAHEAEERRIAELAARWRDDESGDWVSDQYWEACRITQSMYAALVVSIWSDMEHSLKQLISLCQRQRGRPVTPPYHMSRIKKFFLDCRGVDLTQVPEFETVDGIRVLNNSFKHNDGKYKPIKGKPHTQLPPGLLTKWGITESTEIDYASLDIQELVIKCNRFCSALLAEVATFFQPQETP